VNRMHLAQDRDQCEKDNEPSAKNSFVSWWLLTSQGLCMYLFS
jgi:hypothetical protein